MGGRGACGGSGSEAGGGGGFRTPSPACAGHSHQPSIHAFHNPCNLCQDSRNSAAPTAPWPSALVVFTTTTTTAAPPARLPLPLLLQVMPKGDLVLAKVAEAEEKTTGGILLPGSAQTRPTSGEVVALGDGQVGTKQHAFTLKGGETVLYSRFGIGATELEVQGEQHLLIREDDLIGIMPRPNATAEGEATQLLRWRRRVVVSSSLAQAGSAGRGGRQGQALREWRLVRQAAVLRWRVAAPCLQPAPGACRPQRQRQRPTSRTLPLTPLHCVACCGSPPCLPLPCLLQTSLSCSRWATAS